MSPIYLYFRCSVLALLVTVSIAVAGESAYRDAKTSQPLFDHDALGLMGIERETLANELAAYVSNVFAVEVVTAEKGGGRLEFASRMLGVAMQLQARNRAAVVANFKLSRGLATNPMKAEYQPDVLAEYLYTRSKLLMEQGGSQNALLAGYLLAFSVEIDPTNDDAIYDLELREIEGAPIDWTQLYRPEDEPVTDGGDTDSEESVAHSGEPAPESN